MQDRKEQQELQTTLSRLIEGLQRASGNSTGQ